MKLKRHVFIIVALFIAALLPSVVHAQTYYYRWQSGIVFTCSTFGGAITVGLSHQPVEWNFPVGGTFTINYIRNGAVTTDGPFPGPTGMGSFTFGAFAASGFFAYPLTFAIRLDTIIGGSVVYSSTVSVSCSADSSGDATITNVTGGSTSGTVPGSKPVFTDGRLNPDPGAPVAIYCNSSSVTILRINQQTSRGENALTVTSSAINAGLAQAASSGQSVLVGGDFTVGLYALPSKELQVQVNFEKQYNFLFLASRCAFTPGTAGGTTTTTTSGGGTTGGGTYVVQQGDTLFNIARRFGTTTSALAAANGITSSGFIFAGQTLIIPDGTGTVSNSTVTTNTTTNVTSNSTDTYVVRAGDNLFRIALNLGVSLSDLQRVNNIADPTLIFVGQVLIIP